MQVELYNRSDLLDIPYFLQSTIHRNGELLYRHKLEVACWAGISASYQ